MTHLTQAKTAARRAVTSSVTQLCLTAKDLENVGKYQEARALLSDLWPENTKRPNLEGLGAYEKAEVLLRAGTLSAWIDGTKQISSSHDIAKDLIGESIWAFQALGENNKVSEAQTHLAICYWREGAMDEARVLCNEAFSHASLPETKTHALINHALIECVAGQINETHRLLKTAQPLLDILEDNATKGRYHSILAAALKRTGGLENLDRALIEYTAASIHFEAAGHTTYYASSENNISDLLLEFGKYDDAHQHVNNAYNTFRKLGDGTKTAQTLETRARIFIAQKRYKDAERTVLTAVKSLEQSGQQALLAEALITRAIALARLEQRGRALAIFIQAEEIATTAGDTRSSIQAKLTSIEELGTFINPTQLTTLYLQTDQHVDQTFDIAKLSQLRTCAAITIKRLQQSESSNPTTENYQLPENCVLPDEVLRFEAKVINAALDETNGSVTGAARRLGISHQGLGDILNSRHKSLRRNEPKRRHRSIITSKRN